MQGDGTDTVSPATGTVLNFGDACAPPRPACVEMNAAETNAKVLLANGGFERSEALSAKSATLSDDRRVFGRDKVPLNWFFCR